MNILVDENIPLMTVAELRGLEHDVFDLRGTPDEGSEDPVLWRFAQSQKRLLITTDKGFSKQRFEDHCGILIVRLRQPNRHKIHRRIMETMVTIHQADWPGLLVIARDRVASLWRAQSKS